MTSPTQPITPLVATAAAVISVVQTTMTTFRPSVCTPKARASSSPIDSRFSFQLTNCRPIVPAAIAGTTVATVRSVTELKLPSSQYVMAGSLDSGSATYLAPLSSALKNAATTTPDRTSIRTGVV